MDGTRKLTRTSHRKDALRAGADIMEAIKSAVRSQENQTFDLAAVELWWGSAFDKIVAIPKEELSEAQAKREWVTLELTDTISIPCLPGNLRVLQEYYTKAAKHSLVTAYDIVTSHHLKLDKLVTPSLFPELDYDRERLQTIVLGGSLRVEIGIATPEQLKIYRAIKQKNFDDQEARHELDETLFKAQERVFKRHSVRCFDELMAKLHGWKPRAVTPSETIPADDGDDED